MSLVAQEHHAQLYIGDVNTIKDPLHLKNVLRIKCLINCSCDLEFPDSPQNYDSFEFIEKRVPIENFIGVHIIPYLEQVADYIHSMLVEHKHNILIYSFNGRSRSTTFILAYFMKIKGLTLQKALQSLSQICPLAQPNESFMHQLMIFDQTLFGNSSTYVHIRPQTPTWVHPVHVVLVVYPQHALTVATDIPLLIS